MNTETGNILIFDRDRVRQNRARALKNLPQHSFLFDWAETQISGRLEDIKRNFPRALFMGLHGKNNFIIPDDKIKTLIDTGLIPSEKKLNSPFVCADDELLPFADNSFDLVINSLGLHSTNDLPGALVQIKRALKPDGLFMAAMFGGETLFELRQSLMAAEMETRGGISPRVFPFADKPQAGNLMQRAGFALPVIDSEILTVTYDNMFGLLKDLRGMGEGNSILARDKKFPGRNFFHRAAAHYAENFSEHDGRIRATFEVIFMIGWSPHSSQQKPLAPGSAKMRLAEALDTKEIKAGG